MIRVINFLIVVSAAALISCYAIQPANKTDYAAEGFVKAEIKKYEVDGCGFMIFLEDGKKLNPDNLQEQFQREGLKVWVKYGIRKNAMSICMAGDNVIITAIEPRK